jgi:hypothetical protein
VCAQCSARTPRRTCSCRVERLPASSDPVETPPTPSAAATPSLSAPRRPGRRRPGEREGSTTVAASRLTWASGASDHDSKPGSRPSHATRGSVRSISSATSTPLKHRRGENRVNGFCACAKEGRHGRRDDRPRRPGGARTRRGEGVRLFCGFPSNTARRGPGDAQADERLVCRAPSARTAPCRLYQTSHLFRSANVRAPGPDGSMPSGSCALVTCRSQHCGGCGRPIRRSPPRCLRLR